MGPQLDSCGRPQNYTYLNRRQITLQWGRNLTVAEGTMPARVGCVSDPALQWGRNLTVAEGTIWASLAPISLDASMGPQLDSCGRGDDADGPEGHKWTLQWGRNLTVAEGCIQRAGQARRGIPASMGPQLDSCGRGCLPLSLGFGLSASMGPQLDSCGRSRSMGPPLRSPMLQWGRNLTVAEGRTAD